MSTISNHHHPIHNTQTHNTNKQGFTIVELLIVIVVIAILAAISIVSYNGIQARARASATDADLSNLNTKLQVYYIANNNTLPDSLEKLKQDGFGEMVNKMNWGDMNDYNTPRGKYLVYGGSESDGGGYFRIIYWDYRENRWTIRDLTWYPDGELSSYDTYWNFADPDSNPPCRAEKLEQCKAYSPS